MSLLPLSGIRVVDFSSNIAGPFGTMILAQLGADVVKVEPLAGDDSRSFASGLDSGINAVYSYVNVGKRGVALDLKCPKGLEVALTLIKTSDVLLHSMRPGVTDRLGIGQGAALEQNPHILYYDINAFGKGPVGTLQPGYDPLVQAFAGIMEMTGHDDTPPTRCAPSVIDLGTGQWVAMGVLAALLSRANGYDVGTMETALVDTAFSLVGYQATTAYVTGERPRRAGSGNPIAAPYQCYRASDGYFLLAAPSQRLWEKAIRALGAPELIDDERFRTVADRIRNRNDLEEVISAITRCARVKTWVDLLSSENVPAGKVLGLEEAVATDVIPERHTFLECDDVPLVRLPWLVDGRPIEWRRPAPRLGEHTVEVLDGLNYNRDEISTFLACGAIASDQALTLN